MKKLSIVLKEESVDKIKLYIDSVKTLINTIDSELIIISNTADEEEFNLEFEFRLYKYRESYKNFKEFCLDICLSDNILLIESGVLIDDNFVNEIIELCNNNKSNIIVKLKKYISKDKNIYFIDHKNILFNTKSKDKFEIN